MKLQQFKYKLPEDRIAQDTVIINMINTLYGEDLLPLE